MIPFPENPNEPETQIDYKDNLTLRDKIIGVVVLLLLSSFFWHSKLSLLEKAVGFLVLWNFWLTWLVIKKLK